jgi:hypothetical protein
MVNIKYINYSFSANYVNAISLAQSSFIKLNFLQFFHDHQLLHFAFQMAQRQSIPQFNVTVVERECAL